MRNFMVQVVKYIFLYILFVCRCFNRSTNANVRSLTLTLEAICDEVSLATSNKSDTLIYS